ncbi:MAG: universal stress protein [Variovorax sp.]|nr:MAG: universal stress protein [Variovorax sp.]
MYRHILVPIEGSATAEVGLSEAIRLAADQKARLRVLYVVNDLPLLLQLASVSSIETSMQKLRDDGQRLLVAATKLASDADVHAEPVLREVTQGRIADVVVEEARNGACDLIVMGTHGRRGVSRVALGSDAETVARTSPVPVLLVRLNTAGEPHL